MKAMGRALAGNDFARALGRPGSQGAAARTGRMFNAHGNPQRRKQLTPNCGRNQRGLLYEWQVTVSVGQRMRLAWQVQKGADRRRSARATGGRGPARRRSTQPGSTSTSARPPNVRPPKDQRARRPLGRCANEGSIAVAKISCFKAPILLYLRGAPTLRGI
uniref:Uncharacterized protein n=1 Tax=Trichuris muris TaxID=70415 RepID=A0A5S6R3Z5_TRIMR